MTSPLAEAEPIAAPAEEIARILVPNPIFARFDPDSLLVVAGRFRRATYPAEPP